MNKDTPNNISVIASAATAIDAELLRLGFLHSQCGISVVASCATSGELMHAAETVGADVMLVSAALQDGPTAGFLALRELRRSHPELIMVVVLSERDRELIIDAFRTGARGVFIRTDSFDRLCKCIHSVHEGQVWASSSEIQQILDVLSTSVPLRIVSANGVDLLTPRQKQLVQLVAEGMTNREIAGHLHLSEHTVKNYLFRIFDKLGVANRAELIIYAMSRFEQAEKRPSDTVNLTKKVSA